MSLNDSKCRDRCGNEKTAEPHSCPYAADVGNDPREDYCHCCEACQHECAQDI